MLESKAIIQLNFFHKEGKKEIKQQSRKTPRTIMRSIGKGLSPLQVQRWLRECKWGRSFPVMSLQELPESQQQSRATAAGPAGWETRSLIGASRTVKSSTNSKDSDTLQILQPLRQVGHLLIEWQCHVYFRGTACLWRTLSLLP